MQLLRQKQAEIESLHNRLLSNPNKRSDCTTGSGGPLLEGVFGQIQVIIREMMEKLNATPPTAYNIATPASSCFEKKPLIDNNYSPDQYPSSQVTLRDAIEIVLYFNGHTMPVLQFARACNRAKALVSP